MDPMLTHIKITSAKPSEKLYKLHDTLGLYLAVKPNGSKLWRMNYRFLGKQRTLHPGKWPAVGLAAARATRDEGRGQIAAGMDPAIDRKRSEGHPAELQSLMAVSYAAVCLVKQTNKRHTITR